MPELSGLGEVKTSQRFRIESKSPNADAIKKLIEIKKKAIELEELILSTGETRETSLCLTKLEESMFWIEKHLNR